MYYCCPCSLLLVPARIPSLSFCCPFLSLLVVVFVFFACISSLPSFAPYTHARALLAIIASWEWRKIDGLWGWKQTVGLKKFTTFRLRVFLKPCSSIHSFVCIAHAASSAMDDYMREMGELKTLVTKTLEKKGVLARIRVTLFFFPLPTAVHINDPQLALCLSVCLSISLYVSLPLSSCFLHCKRLLWDHGSSAFVQFAS